MNRIRLYNIALGLITLAVLIPTGILTTPYLANASRAYGHHYAAKHTLPPAPSAVPVKHGPALLFSASLIPGEYSISDGLCGSVITLASDHRFEFYSFTDLVTAYRDAKGELHFNNRNQTVKGTWRLEGDRLLVLPDHPVTQDGSNELNLRFIPVKWEERIYLVDENQMPGFCVGAASTDTMVVDMREHWSVIDYRKRPKTPSKQGKYTGYPPLARNSHPVIPQRYKKYYDHGDTRARVSRVEGNKGKTETRLVLNRGALDGITPGMLLARVCYQWGKPDDTRDSERGPADAVVIKVDPHRSIAMLVTFPHYRPAEVRRGDYFTTGDDMNRPSGTGYPWPGQVPNASAERSML